MVLSAEQQAQLQAMFGKSRGRFTLTAMQRSKLLAECVAQERTAAELSLDVPEAESEDVVEEWKDLAKDAGMTKLSDLNGATTHTARQRQGRGERLGGPACTMRQPPPPSLRQHGRREDGHTTSHCSNAPTRDRIRMP